VSGNVSAWAKQREDARPRSAFERLRTLLAGIIPGAEPIDLQLGELRTEDEPDVSALGWTRYPPLGGTAELREAYQGWLKRRFGVLNIPAEPTPGSKQAISLCLAAALRHSRRVLMPNPFYPTYQHATLLQGGEPIYYDATAPDPWSALATALLDGPVAAMLVCHPAAPQGQIYSAEVLTGLQALCASHGTGFVAGDAALVAQYAWANRQLGVSAAVPVCAAAARLWEDEARADRLKARIGTAWNLARRHLGSWPGFEPAASGFFLWLPVGEDENFARTAWRQAGLRVMPGSYLAETVAGHNPGRGFVRIALVHEPEVMERALVRLAGLALAVFENSGLETVQ
jgi:N-succinyldiaminopimelate aminotransferase